MSDWAHGYNVALGYTYGFYRETAPCWQNFAARLTGVIPPPIDKFRYLELGCGQGFGLVLLAALHPQAEFVGIDFNPMHIAHARGLADAADLHNIRFEEADFLNLAEIWPADYGLFDYGVLHGILSWVSRDLRRALTGCLKLGVKPGGLVYASYNAQPGWLSDLTLQHLLTSHQKAKGLAPLPAIEQGLSFMTRLQEAQAGLFTVAPKLSSSIQAASQQERAYLVQEYLHANWKCFWFSELIGELAPAKVEFVGTATLSEVFLPSMLPEPQRVIFNEQTDPIFRQDVLDACINQRFRRDIFQRGLIQGWSARHRDELLQIRLMIVKHPKDNKFIFPMAGGTIEGKLEVYLPLMEALTEKPLSIYELLETKLFSGQPLSMLLQPLTMLLQSNMIGIATEGNTGHTTSIRFNRAVARAVAGGAPYQYLACPYIGNGIKASQTELLLLDCLDVETIPDKELLVKKMIERLNHLGMSLVKDGKTLASPTGQTAEVERLVSIFMAETLPYWTRLGAWY